MHAPDPATLVAAAIYELALAVGPHLDVADLMRRHGERLQATDDDTVVAVGYFLECVAGP